MNNEKTAAGKGLSRRERERLRHRHDILEAGERVFARKGYHGATIEEIASEAEFAVGTIYNFFASKDDLYECILHANIGHFMELFESHVVTASTPLDAVRTLIDLRIEQFELHRGLFRVFFQSLPRGRFGPDESLPASCMAFYDRYFRELCAIMVRGRAAGLFADSDPLSLALALDGIINEFLAYWCRRDPGVPSPAHIEGIKRAALRALGCGTAIPRDSTRQGPATVDANDRGEQEHP